MRIVDELTGDKSALAVINKDNLTVIKRQIAKMIIETAYAENKSTLELYNIFTASYADYKFNASTSNEYQFLTAEVYKIIEDAKYKYIKMKKDKG